MNRWFGIVAIFAASVMMGSIANATESKKLIDVEKSEWIAVSPAVCKKIQLEVGGMVNLIEQGHTREEINGTLGQAITAAVGDDDDYLALWMTAKAQDHIRGLFGSAEVLQFLKRNPQYKKSQAISYIMLTACSGIEGKVQEVPLRNLGKMNIRF